MALLETIRDNWELIALGIVGLIAAFKAFTRLTPTKKDDAIADALEDAVEELGLKDKD